ncbi:MAG: hypothetical protein NPIRA06_14260 [Nitrospirales bacterium]|nr:MAG: hypothetical protein NPIRA06_14260 [Nitrospirales bacterium]
MRVNQAKNILGMNMRVASFYLAGILFLSFLPWILGGTPVYGVSPVASQEHEGPRDLIYQASQATEQAWEEFHAAAIGGTLASPAVQSSIERQLHEARALLMEARKAERDNQFDVVNTLTQKIMQITQNIVQASREKKQ